MNLDRRAFLAALAAAGASATLPVRAASSFLAEGSPGSDVLASSPIFDSFGALEMGVLRSGERGIVVGRGLTAVHTGLPSRHFDVARRALGEWGRRFRRQSEQLTIIRSAEDLPSSVRQGKLGILLGFENATCIGNDVDHLYALHAAGARLMQLTGESRNLVGHGCGEDSNAGLSDFGVAVVETMNELGMVVDLSFCGEATSRDGIQVSRKPPAFTHTSCRALHDQRRAKSDDLLRAIAERGGMIGIHPGADRSTEEHLDHISHAVDVAGIDHIGIASSSGDSSPRSRVSFLTIARGLERRGYRSGAIEKLLGGNWDRYLRQAL